LPLVQAPWPPPPPQASPTVFTRDVLVPGADDSLLHREVTAHFQFGFPAGLRLQYPFAGGPNRYTAVEVFGGSEWTVLVAMAGIRTVFEIPLGNPCNAFLVGTGVHGLYFLASEGNHAAGCGVVVDTTLGWVFDRQVRGSWEVGFNLGLGLIVDEGNVFPIPTFGIYAGYHF
jgi:hypothetical protein